MQPSSLTPQGRASNILSCDSLTLFYPVSLCIFDLPIHSPYCCHNAHSTAQISSMSPLHLQKVQCPHDPRRPFAARPRQASSLRPPYFTPPGPTPEKTLHNTLQRCESHSGLPEGSQFQGPAQMRPALAHPPPPAKMSSFLFHAPQTPLYSLYHPDSCSSTETERPLGQGQVLPSRGPPCPSFTQQEQVVKNTFP